jgi:hypothetical protein
MNSGFITTKRVVNQIGVHQRFDVAAYRMIEQFLPIGAFPTLKDIIHFEGYNGPDGLKIKSPGVNEPSHLYDPVTDTGDAVLHIANHYAGLVNRLKAGDMIRASFEASWLAHYVCDGMTPAHHWPLEERLAEAAALSPASLKRGDTTKFAGTMVAIKKNWAVYGVKGHLSTHFYFETGIAFALLIFPIHPVFMEAEFMRARELGPIDYFKSEARDIAELNLYGRFYKEGWSSDIAAAIKNKIAPQTARAIGLIWMLALYEAGEQLVRADPDLYHRLPGKVVYKQDK